jgi:hypothetical protein
MQSTHVYSHLGYPAPGFHPAYFVLSISSHRLTTTSCPSGYSRPVRIMFAGFPSSPSQTRVLYLMLRASNARFQNVGLIQTQIIDKRPFPAMTEPTIEDTHKIMCQEAGGGRGHISSIFHQGNVQESIGLGILAFFFVKYKDVP